MSDSLKALMDRVALLEAQTFSTKSTLPPLVENPDGLPPMIFPGGAMSYSDWAFGFSISGAVVSVNKGNIRHGTKTERICIARSFTVASDHYCCWVEYEYDESAWRSNWGTAFPLETETTYIEKLHEFRLIAGAASVDIIYHLGDVKIDGAFG
jgi:hypothetical protein